MVEIEKPAWPKTPDGTIDWEIVFEAPETGVIPLITVAPNPASLHKCAEVVIRQLFTRKNDAEQVEKFLAELERIIATGEGDSGFESSKSSVVDLLRRIKTGRIKRAEAYLEQKRKEKAEGTKGSAPERREDGASAGRQILGVFFGSLVRKLVTSGALVLLLAGVVSLIMLTGEPAPPETVEKGVVEDVADAPAEEQEPTDTAPETPVIINVLTGQPESRIEEFDDFVVVMKPLFWTFIMDNNRTRPTHLLPVLGLRDEDDWADVCRRMPSLVEAVNISLSRYIPQRRKTTDDDVRRASQYAMKLMNERLGGEKVDAFALMMNADRRMITMGSRCRLLVP